MRLLLRQLPLLEGVKDITLREEHRLKMVENNAGIMRSFICTFQHVLGDQIEED
jgi:hypothetical protein